MYNIGVDIGGMSVKIGIVDSHGNIIDKVTFERLKNDGFDSTVEKIRLHVDKILEKNNIESQNVKTIGFGVPSFISKNGRVTCVNLGWHDEDFVYKLQNEFKEFEVHAENDATVAAVAEYKFGSMKNNDVALMLTLGTGVGGGIIINGKYFTGANNMGSEVGHIVIGENFYDCNCKTNGCFETFCSASAIIKYAQKLLSEGRESVLNSYVKNINMLTAKMVFDGYNENDAVCICVVERFKKYLAKGIGSLINTIDPSVIALGGGVSKAGNIILDGLRELVRENVLYKEHEFGDIVIAELGNDAGIIGSAFLHNYN